MIELTKIDSPLEPEVEADSEAAKAGQDSARDDVSGAHDFLRPPGFVLLSPNCVGFFLAGRLNGANTRGLCILAQQLIPLSQ